MDFFQNPKFKLPQPAESQPGGGVGGGGPVGGPGNSSTSTTSSFFIKDILSTGPTHKSTPDLYKRVNQRPSSVLLQRQRSGSSSESTHQPDFQGGHTGSDDDQDDEDGSLSPGSEIGNRSPLRNNTMSPVATPPQHGYNTNPLLQVNQGIVQYGALDYRKY